MNYAILKKVSDELIKDNPDISYIRGMVEALLSMQPEVPTPKVQSMIRNIETPTAAEIINLGRTPNLNGIQDFVHKSVKTE